MNIMKYLEYHYDRIVLAVISSDYDTVVHSIDIKSNNDLMEFFSSTIEICAG